MTAGADRAAEATGLLFAALLAALAGLVDAIGYLRLGHLFVSFMSGTTTVAGTALGLGNFAGARQALAIVLLFVCGAACGTLLARAAGVWHLPAVLTAVAALLAYAASLGSDLLPPMVLAMGALNGAMHRAGTITVSLTYVTGVLVRLGEGLGNLLAGRTRGWSWLPEGVIWLGLIGGAAGGALAQERLGRDALWVGAGAAGLMAATATLLPREAAPL